MSRDAPRIATLRSSSKPWTIQYFGEPARLSVNSAEHFKPLLYVLGARADDDSVRFENDHIEYGSLSMTTLVFEPAPKAA